MLPMNSTPMNRNLGRDKIDEWKGKPQIWQRIDQAVHDETCRTKVAAKFLTCYPADQATVVPSDLVIDVDMPKKRTFLTVDEGATTSLIEAYVEFALTEQQIQQEEKDCTAVTLATRAANLLSRMEDTLIFQGSAGLADGVLAAVQFRTPPRPDVIALLGGDQVVPVEPTNVPNPADRTQNKYGENTFGAVARAYSLLQRTHYGRYALALPTNPFSDTWAPLAGTLIMPADRIKGLVSDHFYGTSTLPDVFVENDDPAQRRRPQGVLVALDGNTMDLVMGMDTTTAFMQIDGDGLYRFRVFERFVLRLKDRTAVVRLEFQPGA